MQKQLRDVISENELVLSKLDRPSYWLILVGILIGLGIQPIAKLICHGKVSPDLLFITVLSVGLVGIALLLGIFFFVFYLRDKKTKAIIDNFPTGTHVLLICGMELGSGSKDNSEVSKKAAILIGSKDGSYEPISDEQYGQYCKQMFRAKSKPLVFSRLMFKKIELCIVDKDWAVLFNCSRLINDDEQAWSKFFNHECPRGTNPLDVLYGEAIKFVESEISRLTSDDKNADLERFSQGLNHLLSNEFGAIIADSGYKIDEAKGFYLPEADPVDIASLKMASMVQQVAIGNYCYAC